MKKKLKFICQISAVIIWYLLIQSVECRGKNLKSQRPSLPVIHCNNSAQTFAAMPRLYLLSAFSCFEYRPYINAHWTCQPHFFADRPIMKFDTCHDFISVFAVVAPGQSIAQPAAACSGCQYC